jgi:putative tryptophan/tyrosine transport system substrate-binding protein
MKRRAFITLVGGAAAWPLAAHSQQASMPLIGFIDARSADAIRDRLRGFHQGLKEAGYVEGESVAIAYRFAENKIDRLPELAADLVHRSVAVIATAGDNVAPVAKAATTTTPIVFIVSQDPVALGLVASLARPGGNVTGINFFTGELVAKQLEFLHQLAPAATRIGMLINPTNALSARATVSEAEAAINGYGLQIQTINASSSREIDVAFEILARDRYDALLVASDPFFSSRRVQLVNLTARHAIPTAFSQRDFIEIGGLMSYASNIIDAWRQSGVYVGRILKGAKPADLPVVQASKFELVINAQTARMLGLSVPPSLLAIADEVIE